MFWIDTSSAIGVGPKKIFAGDKYEVLINGLNWIKTPVLNI